MSSLPTFIYQKEHDNSAPKDSVVFFSGSTTIIC